MIIFFFWKKKSIHKIGYFSASNQYNNMIFVNTAFSVKSQNKFRRKSLNLSKLRTDVIWVHW